MNKRDFIRGRRPSWIRFNRLLTKLQTGTFRGLSGEGVLEFSRLFREISHDLAEVRTRGWGGRLETYLNDLAARGHNTYYRAPPGKLRAALHFLTAGYPRIFREYQGYFFVAAALFFLPLIVTAVTVYHQPGWASRIIPAEQLQMMEFMYKDAEQLSEELEEGVGGSQFREERVAMGGFYINNNIGIALRAFVSGLFYGVITIYVLLSNGITIGAVMGYLMAEGRGLAFTSFVISHGAFELTAICVAGGAGLMLGNALLHPGNRTPMASLLVRGRAAVQHASGAAVMLLIAALLEAFFSPMNIQPTYKYIVGTLLWVLVFLYLFVVGRQPTTEESDEPNLNARRSRVPRLEKESSNQAATQQTMVSEGG